MDDKEKSERYICNSLQENLYTHVISMQQVFVQGTTAADSNSVSGSLVRFPDGSDTDDANTDWSFSSIPTPGIPNPIP